MPAKFIIPVILFFAALSCKEERLEPAPDEEVVSEQENSAASTDSDYYACDSVFIATYHGTACCVSGYLEARRGDVFKYHYQMNRDNPEIQWEIRDGDITIEEGQGTHTVTVKFGPDFTKGDIGGVGVGTVTLSDTTVALLCSANITIRKPD